MKKGIYGKYIIKKTDGSDIDPNACYFVLRLDSDAAAQDAARTYAEQTDNEELANDILMCLEELHRPSCGCREASCPHEPLFSKVWTHGG